MKPTHPTMEDMARDVVRIMRTPGFEEFESGCRPDLWEVFAQEAKAGRLHEAIQSFANAALVMYRQTVDPEYRGIAGAPGAAVLYARAVRSGLEHAQVPPAFRAAIAAERSKLAAELN